jgi:hypothetical protein
VAKASDGGHFEFYESSVYNNYATQIPVFEIFDSSQSSILDSTQLYDNAMIDNDEFISEVTSCQKL